MLIFIDGADHYAGGDILEKWSTVRSTANLFGNTGRFGVAGCLQFNNANAALAKNVSALATYIVGFAFKPLTSTNGNVSILRFMDNGSSGCQASLCFNNSFQLQAYRGEAATLLGTASGTYTVGTWYYVEVKCTVNGSTGVFSVQVNGANVLNLTTQNTKAQTTSTTDQIAFGMSAGGNSGAFTFSIDDIYICDTTGSVNNDFLGDRRVQTLYPSLAGNYAQWTPNASTNVSRVNEVSNDGDTTYNSSFTIGQIDSFLHGALIVGTTAPNGVQTNHTARKDDAGTRQIAPLLRQASTDYVGTTQTVGSSYVDYMQVYEQDPSTSAAWTVTGVNSVEIGVKVIA